MKPVLLFLALAIAWNICSQDAPMKWKEIAMDDLQMKQFESDTSVSAVILSDYGQRYFDINPNGKNLFLFDERHIRIKILKPEGLKYAHVRIPFKDMVCEQFPGENSIVIKGISYKLDKKGELVATRLKLKNIKYKDSINCMKIAEFELPDVEPGSVIEYKYIIPKLDLVYPETWYFQNDIPTLYSEFRMRIPIQFEYMLSPQNIPNFEISEQTYFNQTLLYNSPYYSRYRGYTNIFSLNGKQIRLVLKNVDKLEYQSFTSGYKEFSQALKLHLVKATRESMDYTWEPLTHALAITTTEDYDLHDPGQRKLISYPAGYIYYKMPNWDMLNSKLLKSDKFGLALIKHWNHEPILEEILKGVDNDELKLIAVYNYIRKNMKWTGKYELFVDPVFNMTISKLFTRITKKLSNEKSLRKPFEEKEGTSSEINFILIYLLNKAGIETHPVIISTRDNGRIDTNIVEPKQFNHTIALAKLGDKQIFLDATDSLRPFKLLNKNDLTDQGFLIKNEGFGWITVQNTEETESIMKETIAIDNNLNINSKIQVQETGYFALDHRKQILSKGKDSVVQKISGKYASLAGSKQVDIQNIDNDAVPFAFEISKSEKATDKNTIKVKPSFNPIYKAEDFNEPFRKFPVEFPYPFKQTYTMELQIPEGFTVELPENKSYSTFGGNVGFQYEAMKNENTIRISVKLEIKLKEFPVPEYYKLAELFTVLNEKINQEIVIRKL